ncbi:hypothetical protein GCM10025770_35100 [Viridibacterium curvum]|uniref:PDZ domain-containing protein n=2 Tax=Viridibacterium curvum TaxID=1101404 RepID=A0ABP9R3G6_9RHOO
MCRTALIWAVAGLAIPRLALAAEAPSAQELRQAELDARAFALTNYLNDLKRLERVTYRLLRTAAPYCRDAQVESIGIPPVVASDLPADLRPAFIESGPLSTLPRFHHVLGGSPLANIGVAEGDLLQEITIQDRDVKRSSRFGWFLDRSVQAMTLQVSNPIQITFVHGREAHKRSVEPDVICKLTPALVSSNTLSASVERNELRVSLRVLRELQLDDELALVVAQRIGHWLSPSQMTGAARERNADYLSAFLLHGAGFNLIRAQNAWHKLNLAETLIGSQKPAFNDSALHSATLKRAQDEIKQMQLAAKRVVPAHAHLRMPADSRLIPKNAGSAPDSTMENSATPAGGDARLYDLASIPFVDAQGIAGYQRFLDTPLRPRAFVIGRHSSNGKWGWSLRFGPNAAVDAIVDCEKRLGGPFCQLYALDEEVVWVPAQSQRMPEPSIRTSPVEPAREKPISSQYANIQNIEAVPIVESELGAYRAFLAKPAPRTFVVLDGGTSKYWVGTSAMENALRYCEASPIGCWLYAVDDVVVWSKEASQRISRRDQLPMRASEQDFLQK